MIGEYIKKQRLQLNYTQRELAEELNVSKAYIHLIENNFRKVGKKYLTTFAKVLNVPIEELKENNIIPIKSKKIIKKIQTIDIDSIINLEIQRLDFTIQQLQDTINVLETTKNHLQKNVETSNEFKNMTFQDIYNLLIQYSNYINEKLIQKDYTTLSLSQFVKMKNQNI